MADPKVQLRQELKSAREALDKKEWKEALQHCKAALKLDGKNYNVFVFIGLAAAELGQEKQSEEAYRRATALQPSTILAWQVIVRLYRECPPWGGACSTLHPAELLFNFRVHCVGFGQALPKDLTVGQAGRGLRGHPQAHSVLLLYHSILPLLLRSPY